MPVNVDESYNTLCQGLGYDKEYNFIESVTDTENINLKVIFYEVKEKIKIDAIYFLHNAHNSNPTPILLFKKYKIIDSEEIRQLYTRVWNLTRVPYLFVISPTEIKLYNCFAPPLPEQEDLDDQNHLIAILKGVITVEKIIQTFLDFSRENIDLGKYTIKGKKGSTAINKADKYLLTNLRILRDRMISSGLNQDITQNLIERSIFILFLQDRGMLESFFSSFKGAKYKNFTQILANKGDTYKFFNLLGEHFNGDIIPVPPDEEKQINDSHLKELSFFLQGVDLVKKQKILFPYRFDVIPIEFIGSVYDEFLDISKKDKKEKNFYHRTPLNLVELLVNQIDLKSSGPKLKILDPSCGSGIFLVSLFRRIIILKLLQTNRKQLPLEELKEILINNIFGIEIKKEAIRVAQFSLYLAFLEYIDPSTLLPQKNVLPNLLGLNLLHNDFLKSDELLQNTSFDIIIGNIPWESHSTNVNKIEGIGDKQLAQAFLKKTLEFANKNTVICLIVTAKGLLHNRSKQNKLWRKNFFEKTNIQTIFNFSELRNYLFEYASGPAAAIIFSQRNGRNQNYITYVVPKPSLESKKAGIILIDSPDVMHIPQEIAIEDSTIWKCALFGTSRDWNILNKLRLYPSLRDHCANLNWPDPGEGFQLTKGKTPAEWMKEFDFLPLKQLYKFTIPRNLNKCEEELFHRSRDPSIYKAPLCLIKMSPKKGEIIAAFTDNNTCYTESIMGIPGKIGDEWALKIITSYVNTKIAQYFLFLTCSKWGVERGDNEVDEYLDLPLNLPEKNSNVAKEIIELHDDLVLLANKNAQNTKKWNELNEKLNELFYHQFNLSDVEKYIINDTINFGIEFSNRRENSIVFSYAGDDFVANYASIFKKTLDLVLSGQHQIDVTIYNGSDNFFIIKFKMISGEQESIIKFVDNYLELNKILSQLRNLIEKDDLNDINSTKILKFYESDTIYIGKPKEIRYWTGSMAYKDADDSITEILELWSEQKLV